MSVPETKIQAVQQTSIGWTRDQVELVKRTVAKDATDDELKMFLYLARQYNLDPFKKEIVFTKFQNRPSFITTRDGYLKIAMSDPNFDGLQAFVVHEGDEFEIIAEEFRVHHKFGLKRGKIIGAWGAAYHKQRKPVICFVEFEEYNKPSWNTWKEYPSAMIQKVAEAFVLKRQFNISGLVTREEIGMETADNSAIDAEALEIDEADDETPEPEPESNPQPQPQTQTKPAKNGGYNWSKIWMPAKEAGWANDDVHSFTGLASLTEMSTDWLNNLSNTLVLIKNAKITPKEARDVLGEAPIAKFEQKDWNMLKAELFRFAQKRDAQKKDTPRRGQREERGVWPSSDSEAAMTIEQAVYADDDLND